MDSRRQLNIQNQEIHARGSVGHTEASLLLRIDNTTISSIIEPNPDQESQIIPFPLIGNTTNPLDWVEVFSDLVSRFSLNRLGNNLPDCIQVNA